MLRPFDAWSERNAWLVVGLVFGLEAALHFWLAAVHFPSQDPCPAGLCSPETLARVDVARLLAQVFVTVAAAATLLHLMRGVPAARQLPAALPLTLRWLVGSGLVVAAAIFLLVVAGAGFTASLKAQYAAFALVAAAAGLNLFPRRLRPASEAATPSH